jgi:hypothetical protein
VIDAPIGVGLDVPGATRQLRYMPPVTCMDFRHRFDPCVVVTHRELQRNENRLIADSL